MKSGVECNYFRQSRWTALSDDKDIQAKPCYDSAKLPEGMM